MSMKSMDDNMKITMQCTALVAAKMFKPRPHWRNRMR